MPRHDIDFGRLLPKSNAGSIGIVIVSAGTTQSPRKANMDIGRCFNEALDVYKKNLWTLVLGALLFEVLFLVSFTILAGPLIGGWSLMTINALRRKDRSVELGDMFAAFDQFFTLAGLFYLTLIPVLLGTVLCLVPGLLLMTIWFFASFLVVDRKEGVFSSLTLSQTLVTNSGFGNYFLLVIIVFAISMAPCAIPYVGFILGWFLMPIAWLLEASAYLQEVDEKQCVGQDLSWLPGCQDRSWPT